MTVNGTPKLTCNAFLRDYWPHKVVVEPLNNFPVIRDLVIDPDDAAIVSAILAIARQLGLNVVAEGVETEEQRVFLTERMCPQLQGFLLSPPLAAEDFGALLRNGLAPRKRSR